MDVQILAGTPGTELDTRNGADGRYPATTTDIAKLLRERGLDVVFEHDRTNRKYLSLHSSDLWIPIISVSLDVLTAIGAGLMTGLIQDLFGKTRATSSTLHVTYQITDSTGRKREFSAVGPGSEVLDALETFEKGTIDGEPVGE